MAHLVTAVVKPHRLDEVRLALRDIGVMGLTITEVRGYGRQGGKTETFRGSEYSLEFIPKLRLEVLVPTERADLVVRTIAEAAYTGRIGDGMIWALSLDDVLRVRTSERGDDAL